jgi:O-methyltransferase involved in polyketide biosynthesis
MDPMLDDAFFRDPVRPNPARVHDHWLGGKDSYGADRAAADDVSDLAPWVPGAARADRDFTRRTVAALARAGTDQFLDLGCGLPTGEPIHELVLRRRPGARVVYVDHDPVVLSHTRAMVTGQPEITVRPGDLRHAGPLLDDPALRSHLDLGRPVAALVTAVLQHLTDDEAGALLAGLRERLAVGSTLVVSQLTCPGGGTPGDREAARCYAAAVGPLFPRDGERLTALLDGWVVEEPGVTDLQARTRSRADSRPATAVLAAVARRR